MRGSATGWGGNSEEGRWQWKAKMRFWLETGLGWPLPCTRGFWWTPGNGKGVDCLKWGHKSSPFYVLLSTIMTKQPTGAAQCLTRTIGTVPGQEWRTYCHCLIFSPEYLKVAFLQSIWSNFKQFWFVKNCIWIDDDGIQIWSNQYQSKSICKSNVLFSLLVLHKVSHFPSTCARTRKIRCIVEDRYCLSGK